MYMSSINLSRILSGEYLQLCQTSKIELFAKIVDGFQPLTFLTWNSIFDDWQCLEYVSAYGVDKKGDQ